MNIVGICFGIILCVLSIFILYKRIFLIIFGKSAKGTIIGYGNCIKGNRGFDSYNYKVEYEYNNKNIIANSIENVQVARNDIPGNIKNNSVEIYFSEKNLELCTIKDIKTTTKLGLFIFLIGIIIIAIFSVI